MTNYSERLDEVLAAVYLAGTENGLSRRLTDAKEIMHRKEAFIRGNPASKEANQAITSLIKELVAESRIDGAIIGAKFGNAAFRQYNIAGKPMNLDEIRDVGIKQAEDWAKRQC